MTVQTTTSRADYTGNGVTTLFTVPFYFLDNSHVQVLRTQISTGVITTLAITTDYTVAGAGVGIGGSITCLVAPTADQKISILRDVPKTQLTHYVENDPFPAASHENALDLLTMEVQQLDEVQSRALTLAANTPAGTVSATLPTPAASQLLGWDATAEALQNVDPASLLSIAGSSGFTTQTFSGTGAQTVFTLSANPGSLPNLEVFISGVRQLPTTDYSVSSITLTFTSAPPLGTNNVFVRWGVTVGVGALSDGTVTTNTIADNAVTSAKMSNTGVTPATYTYPSVTVDAAGRVTAISSGVAPVAPGLVLLATLTPTAAANVDFLSTFSSTYDNYLIIGEGVVSNSGTTDSLYMRFGNAGAADTGSNYFTSAYNSLTTAAVAGMQVTGTVLGSGKGAGFVINVQNANATTQAKTASMMSQYHSTATPGYNGQSLFGTYTAANAASGVRFYWLGGNNFLAQGAIKAYGYKNS